MKNTIELCFVLFFNNAFCPKLTLLKESTKRLVKTTPTHHFKSHRVTALKK